MMIKDNFNKISTILDKKDNNYYKLYFFGFFIISILETISVGLVPAYFTIIVDPNLLLEQLKFNDNLYKLGKSSLDKENIILYFTVIILLFFLIKFIYSISFHFFEAKFFNKIKIKLSSSIAKIYLKKNYLFHTINNPLVLGRNITTEVNITISYLKSFIIVIKELTQIFLIFLLLFVANYKITLFISIFSAILTFIYLKIFYSKILKKSEMAFFERGEKSKIINQILESILEVKLYNKSKYFIDKFVKSIAREFESIVFFEIINKLPKIFIEFFIVCLVCCSIFYATFLTLDIVAFVPILALYFFAALRIYPSLNTILLNRLSLVQGEVSLNQVYKEIINSDNDIDDDKDLNKKVTFKNSIELKNVSLKYKDRLIALEKINLTINKFETVGIVGKTGTGKSTLIKIIMGLIEPDTGIVQIDGNDLKLVKKSWHEKIGYVPQNFSLIDDTISANILFGNNEDDKNKINNVLKEVSLDSFVNNLPDKINTLVGPGAKQISGGQAQRIAIARALYRNPSLLIFDEATSSLDDKTENEIINNIYRLKKDKTIIIITHKESLLKDCDKVFKIKDGKLSELDN